jgi:hypothetical protein
MLSDTPTTEAGRLTENDKTYLRSRMALYHGGRRHGMAHNHVECKAIATLNTIEAEAVRSFAERVRREVEAMQPRLNGGLIDGFDPFADPLIPKSAVLALLQAETPDASDSGEGGMREYGSLHDDHADVVEDCAECWQDADDKGSPPKPATREPRP